MKVVQIDSLKENVLEKEEFKNEIIVIVDKNLFGFKYNKNNSEYIQWGSYDVQDNSFCEDTDICEVDQIDKIIEGLNKIREEIKMMESKKNSKTIVKKSNFKKPIVC